MKKTYNVLSILAVILAGFSIFLFILSLIFWRPLAALLDTPPEVIAMGPVIPIAGICDLLRLLFVTIMLLAFARKNSSMAFNILMILLLIAFPSMLINFLQSRWSAYWGAIKIAAYSITTYLTNFCFIFSRLSYACCLVMCGMRIANSLRAKEAAAGSIIQ